MGKMHLPATNDKINSEHKPVSKFDWNKEILTPDTLITDSYKNTENVRRFFRAHIGEHFYFTVEFMNWMNHNPGKKLSDAILTWEQLREQKKDNSFKSELASQLDYNRYIRRFLAENADMVLADAIKYWKLKRVQGQGKSYDKTDLELE